MATRIARVSLCSIAVLAMLVAPFSALAAPAMLAPPAYRSAASGVGVPATVLFSVALQESGMIFNGRLRPWPWTLNVAGDALRYATRDQACRGLRRALQTNVSRRVDVGLGQVNIGFHGHRVADPCDLLDPYRNLAITAKILREQHTPGEDWLIAIGRYHRPAGGEPAAQYSRSVQKHHFRTFGTSALSPATSVSLR